MQPNETEITHDRVAWQTRCSCFAMGLLASSIGQVPRLHKMIIVARAA